MGQQSQIGKGSVLTPKRMLVGVGVIGSLLLIASASRLPVHQRPPQFDYLYRANETAKARAEYEIAEMKGKLELLAEKN
jgi:hypothetical protein